MGMYPIEAHCSFCGRRSEVRITRYDGGPRTICEICDNGLLRDKITTITREIEGRDET